MHFAQIYLTSFSPSRPKMLSPMDTVFNDHLDVYFFLDKNKRNWIGLAVNRRETKLPGSDTLCLSLIVVGHHRMGEQA